ncbi:MAG: DciA family protein [Gemmatimonadaceae bacterium]
MTEKKRKPMPLADALSGFLARSGLSRRVAQATVVDEWPQVVGPQIAAVTKALSITPDGTLFVAVSTHGWMTELSLMEPQLLRTLNSSEGRAPIRKIRFQLRR